MSAAAATLQDIIAEVFGCRPDEVDAVMIHLERATERLPLISALETALHTPLRRVPAADGRILIKEGHPTLCMMEPEYTRTAGEVGCLVSHIRAAKEALESGKKWLVVFEDDCVASSDFDVLQTLRKWLYHVRGFFEEFSWTRTRDLILLADGGCYDNVPLTPMLRGTQRFNCTHAMILSKPLLQKLVDVYAYLLRQGRTAPIDGLLSVILYQEAAYALTPIEGTLFFRQDTSGPSYTLEGRAPPTNNCH
jgi:hypothetical protein